MILCVCGGGEGGGLSILVKWEKKPNIWISVKIVCLVSRFRTRGFQFVTNWNFPFYSCCYETLKRETTIETSSRSAAGNGSLHIPGSLVRWTDRLDVTISVGWDMIKHNHHPNKETAIRDLETVEGPRAEQR